MQRQWYYTGALAAPNGIEELSRVERGAGARLARAGDVNVDLPSRSPAPRTPTEGRTALGKIITIFGRKDFSSPGPSYNTCWNSQGVTQVMLT